MNGAERGKLVRGLTAIGTNGAVVHPHQVIGASVPGAVVLVCHIDSQAQVNVVVVSIFSHPIMILIINFCIVVRLIRWQNLKVFNHILK